MKYNGIDLVDLQKQWLLELPNSCHCKDIAELNILKLTDEKESVYDEDFNIVDELFCPVCELVSVSDIRKQDNNPLTVLNELVFLEVNDEIMADILGDEYDTEDEDDVPYSSEAYFLRTLPMPQFRGVLKRKHHKLN